MSYPRSTVLNRTRTSRTSSLASCVPKKDHGRAGKETGRNQCRWPSRTTDGALMYKIGTTTVRCPKHGSCAHNILIIKTEEEEEERQYQCERCLEDIDQKAA